MVTTTMVNAALSVAGAICAYLCIVNLCNYFHVDEKDVLKRLMLIKGRYVKENNIDIESNFSLTKNQFQFKIFSKIFKDIKLTDFLTKKIEQADIPWQVDTFIIVSLILGVIPLIFALLISPLIGILAPIGLLLPYIYVHMTIKKRYAMFTQQLPDAMDLLCNALRAGHSLFSAFDVIVKEMPNPISKIFKILTDEIALGMDAKDAMRSLQESMPNSVDLRFFTTVVILQREIGGNLIRLLELLAGTIRERFKMLGQLQAQTMQAKISGAIVSAIPPIIAVVLFFMAPDYMKYLTDHIIGKCALGASALLMIIGFFVIRKITDIDI